MMKGPSREGLPYKYVKRRLMIPAPLYDDEDQTDCHHTAEYFYAILDGR